MGENVKHTPGPWEIEDQGSLYVSTMHPMPIFELVPLVGRRDEHRANACLIAAAPDLLEALKDLIEAYSKPDERLCCDGRDCGCMGSTVHQQAEHYARAAIAKAEARP